MSSSMFEDVSMFENMSLGTVLLLGGFSCGIVYFLGQRFASELRRRQIISSHGCKSPPRFLMRDPVFGLDYTYQLIQALNRKSLMPMRRSNFELCGMTHSSRVAGKPAINTIEPENIKAVQSTHFKDFVVGPARRKTFAPLMKNTIIVVDGMEWEHSRAFLKPSFSRSQVGDLTTLEVHVKHLIKIIPDDGSIVDLGELFFRYTADVITDLMFGESILSLSHPEVFGSDLMKACRDISVGTQRRFLLGNLAHFVPQRDYYRSVRKMHAYVDSHVERAIRQRLSQEKSQEKSEADVEDNGKYVLLTELAKLTDDRLILRDQLLGMFFAGRDTTAALLGNLFFVLARNLDVWQRLQEEVTSLEGRQPTLDELKKLKYLSFCLNESATR